MILTQVLPTPAGPLSLLVHDDVLVAAGFTADPRELFARLSPELRALPLKQVDDLGKPARAVRDYLDGNLTALDAIPVDQPGTSTRRRLHAALRAVPAGETVTYADLAERAGMPRTTARAAGSACSQNLVAPFVPCHRVLPSTGGSGAYYYGPDVKEWLLHHERQAGPLRG
jgi:methylated-DNA-[protein]-cysteine S-methyltransferase